MGHFENDYEHASADLVDYYSQPISYTDDSEEIGGVPVDGIEAMVYSERRERRKNDYGWYWMSMRRVVLINNEIALRSDGKFTIDGRDYSIESTGEKAGDRTVVELVRSEAGEVNRPGYRGYGR